MSLLFFFIYEIYGTIVMNFVMREIFDHGTTLKKISNSFGLVVCVYVTAANNFFWIHLLIKYEITLCQIRYFPNEYLIVRSSITIAHTIKIKIFIDKQHLIIKSEGDFNLAALTRFEIKNKFGF